MTVIRALGGSAPASDEGVALLAGAYVTVGRKNDAAAVIAPFWRDPKLSDELESTIRQEFGALLTPGDKKARMDALLYAERPLRRSLLKRSLRT